MKIRFPVENGDTLQAVQQFLRQLLTTAAVDLLLTPMHTPHGAIAPALVSDPALLVNADPLAPVLPVNAAALAGQVSARKPRPRVGVVLRSCELRALVELVKLQQASLDDMLLIAVDCAGVYNVPTYLERVEHNGVSDGGLWRELFQAAREHPEEPPAALRQACQICDRPVCDPAGPGALPALVVIELLTSPLAQGIDITLPDELAQRLGCTPAEGDQRQVVIDRLTAARIERRDAAFASIRERLEGEETLAGVFAACIRCHNCMTVCPLCYCKTCVFKSQVFDHDPMEYLGWAKQKGAYRLPADTTLFHLTRLNHMALSCVGCGMCTEACPADLPVGTVFRAIGQKLQGVFNYQPGQTLDEKPPLITFKADEWTTVGE